MTRSIFAVAPAALAVMAFFAPAAEACISCDYVPSVVHSVPQGSSGGYEGRSYRKERAASEERSSRRTKKRVAKSEPEPEAKTKKHVAKSEAEPETKKVKTAKTAPSKSDDQSERSSVSTAKADTNETGATKVEAAKTTSAKAESETENSNITTATLQGEKNVAAGDRVEEVKADKNVGCKKFFPTVGLTLTVPCE